MSDIDALAKAAERRIAMSGRSALVRARAEDRLSKLVAATAARAALTPRSTSSSWPWIAAGGAVLLAAAAVTSVFTRSATAPATTATASAPESTRNEIAAAVPARAAVTIDSLPSVPGESSAESAGTPPQTLPVVRSEPTRTTATPIARSASAVTKAIGTAAHSPPSTPTVAQGSPAESPASEKAIEAAPPIAAESAASLFEQANTARRASAYAPAEKLYRRLLDGYPDSREAATSRIILGRMILSRGDATAALALFDRYLAESAAGSLAEQALVGRARCLQQLQRRDEERAAWRRLLDTFPGSPSRAEALERLR